MVPVRSVNVGVRSPGRTRSSTARSRFLLLLSILNVHCYASHEEGEVLIAPGDEVDGCHNGIVPSSPSFYFIPWESGTLLVLHDPLAFRSLAARFDARVEQASFEAGRPEPQELSFDVSVIESRRTETREDGTWSTDLSIVARFEDAIFHVDASARVVNCNLRWPYAYDASDCHDPGYECP